MLTPLRLVDADQPATGCLPEVGRGLLQDPLPAEMHHHVPEHQHDWRPADGLCGVPLGHLSQGDTHGKQRSITETLSLSGGAAV